MFGLTFYRGADKVALVQYAEYLRAFILTGGRHAC